MKVIKYFLIAVGYLVAFIVITFLVAQISDSLISDQQIEQFARYFGVYGIENILDLYFDTSMITSSIIAILIICLCRIYICWRTSTLTK
jgi:hypothetical protein